MPEPVNISPELMAMYAHNLRTSGWHETAAALEALRSALTARDDRISELERRMTDARRILTNGNPTPDCNWGILDVTRDLKP